MSGLGHDLIVWGNMNVDVSCATGQREGADHATRGDMEYTSTQTDLTWHIPTLLPDYYTSSSDHETFEQAPVSPPSLILT